MRSGILFPLSTAKIWHSDIQKNKHMLESIVKEALLFFDIVKFEKGFYAVSYGETGTQNIKGPYIPHIHDKKDGSDFFEGKKTGMYVSIQREDIPNAPWHTVISTKARSYNVCYEQLLKRLSTNCSKKELSFIKLVELVQEPYLEDVKKQISTDVGKDLRNDEVRQIVHDICTEFDIGTISDRLILTEIKQAVFLSRVFDSPPIVDEFHRPALFVKQGVVHTTLHNVLNVIVPDFSSLPLERIIDLRKDASINEFRRVVSDISKKMSSSPKEVDTESISQQVNSELLKDLDSLAPHSKLKIVINGLIDASSPPIISIPKSIFDTHKSLKKRINWEQSFGCFCLKLKSSL